VFLGASTNTPKASLTGELSRNGSAYAVDLEFHRTDQAPPLDWKVMTNLPLSTL
jgi:hypothetical protein